MRIKKLNLNNFRNHGEFRLNVEKDIIAIIGKNGVGKTNILEAVSLMLPGRGLRKARLTELQKQGAEVPWSVFAEFHDKDEVVQIGTGFDPQKFLESGKEKRIVRINGETKRSQNSLLEYVSMIWLTPSQDQTFQSGTVSREFLDRICELFFPEYLSQLAVYNNARSQRRSLLAQNRQDDKWLSALEVQMAQRAIAITYSRSEVIERINRAMELTKHSTFPAALIETEGEIEDILKTKNALNAENEYLDMLKNSRQQDAYTGKTAYGPHRTRLKVTHLEKNQIAELCSTGEQKALLLSITLASCAAKRSFSGTTPIILLDEVIAHLDAEKSQKLLQFLMDIKAQIWATAVDFDRFKIIKQEAQILSI
jgi:DNA replication and repair protein RecF